MGRKSRKPDLELDVVKPEALTPEGLIEEQLSQFLRFLYEHRAHALTYYNPDNILSLELIVMVDQVPPDLEVCRHSLVRLINSTEIEAYKRERFQLNIQISYWKLCFALQQSTDNDEVLAGIYDKLRDLYDALAKTYEKDLGRQTEILEQVVIPFQEQFMRYSSNCSSSESLRLHAIYTTLIENCSPMALADDEKRLTYLSKAADILLQAANNETDQIRRIGLLYLAAEHYMDLVRAFKRHYPSREADIEHNYEVAIRVINDYCTIIHDRACEALDDSNVYVEYLVKAAKLLSQMALGEEDKSKRSALLRESAKAYGTLMGLFNKYYPGHEDKAALCRDHASTCLAEAGALMPHDPQEDAGDDLTQRSTDCVGETSFNLNEIFGTIQQSFGKDYPTCVPRIFRSGRYMLDANKLLRAIIRFSYQANHNVNNRDPCIFGKILHYEFARQFLRIGETQVKLLHDMMRMSDFCDLLNTLSWYSDNIHEEDVAFSHMGWRPGLIDTALQRDTANLAGLIEWLPYDLEQHMDRKDISYSPLKYHGILEADIARSKEDLLPIVRDIVKELQEGTLTMLEPLSDLEKCLPTLQKAEDDESSSLSSGEEGRAPSGGEDEEIASVHTL